MGTELRKSSRALIFSSVVLASLYLLSLAMASAGRLVTMAGPQGLQLLEMLLSVPSGPRFIAVGLIALR
ncbi:hypothetical protein ASAC_0093 [Acidilobus saccharovorans 345-15]|uniref:Uncharacterized protein n=1 Tax=Acidilobus saccharovorans (strain DSM 16705 / JCM 18335 / VKM B-2471 / 345-15) TaxID=666510 RepID=D9PZL3_ACIS3|nr:hypothetical protein ASAC_0093 [Acidilobus saccharovorans 345-15]